MCLLQKITKKNDSWIAMNYFGRAFGGKRNKALDFGGDPDHDLALVEIGALPSIMVVMS